MPALETEKGKPVEVGPVDEAAAAARFQQSMNDDGPDDQAPPKRQPRAEPAPGDVRAARRAARAPKAEKARTTAKAATVLDDGTRAQGVTGLVQLGAGLCLLASKASKKNPDAWKADAVTVASSADQIADACIQVAKNDPGFAAALDKVCSVGPYGALISVMVGVGSQVARNHKPSLVIPGTVDPAELLKQIREPETEQQGAEHVPAGA